MGCSKLSEDRFLDTTSEDRGRARAHGAALYDPHDAVLPVVAHAIREGYRLFDTASASNLDLGCAPYVYVLYGVEYLGLVSLGLLYAGLPPVWHGQWIKPIKP